MYVIIYRALAEGCGFTPKGRCEDPKVACWMLDPGQKEKNLHRMVTNLLPTEVHMLHGTSFLLLYLVTNTVKFCYKDHLKLRPPSLLRPLVSVTECSFKCKWVSLMRPVHYYKTTFYMYHW